MIDSQSEHRLSPETELALDQAAEMLCKARMPLIYGLTWATLEAQAVAVDVAEALRGIIDTPASMFVPQRGTTLQLYGEARTTARNQNEDLRIGIFVINPTADQIKQFKLKSNSSVVRVVFFNEKYKDHKEANSLFVEPPEFCLRLDEILVAISQGTEGLNQLRSRNITNRCLFDDLKWNTIITLIKKATYPIISYDPQQLAWLYGSQQAPVVINQIEQIALYLSRSGHAACERYDSNDNAAGADYVLTARTGASCAVSFASGHAKFSPLDYSVNAAVDRSLADIVLFIGDGRWPDVIDPDHLIPPEQPSIPWVLIGSLCLVKTEYVQPKNVFIECRNFETEESGTILREDGVPLPLRAAQKSDLPSMEFVLKALLSKITKHKSTLAV